MGGGQIVHTVCMDTRDAVHRDEGEFTMRLGGDNPRFQAIKVALGSLELPMVQWTIEEDWNRLYYSEGYRLTETSSWLRIYEQSDADANEILLHLPLHHNKIVELCPQKTWLCVRCEYPHGLWTAGRRSMIPAIDWGDVELICGPMGRVSLSHLQQNGKIEYLSDHEFLIPHFECDSKSGGFVHVPTIPSPSALCATVGYGLAYADTLGSYEVTYEPKQNRTTLQSTMFPSDSSTLVVKLYGSELAALLGYPSQVHERRFTRPRAPPNFQEAGKFDFFSDAGDRPPLQLPSEPFAGWSYVELEPGWYAPTHRPMCTGQPLRLPQEAEGALNRLYFPIPERVPQGMATAHFLMFTDPGGSMHNCPVYPGRYTGDSMAAVLETEMTQLSARSMPGTVFTVEYDAVAQRFVFVCEVRDEHGTVRPAPFGLALNHPAQFDPSRIGFAPVALYGQDTYTSTHRVVIPQPGRFLRPSNNIYRVTEMGHQKRLRIQSVAPTQLVGIILDYDVEERILRLRTYGGQLPFAHGLVEGDVVQLSPAHASSELFRFSTEDGEWKMNKYSRCPIAPTWGRSGIVVPCRNPGGCGDAMPGAEPLDLCLCVRSTPELTDYIGQVLSIHTDAEPFNLCFGLPRSIGCVQMGFPPGATQWGIDGSTLAGRRYIPPFDAPYVHALDHPDYILIYLAEGKRSAGLQHQWGTNTTSPFAKLVLYPMFREERMLPRETTLLSGETFSVFTLRFANPDGTPYHFHGANFSFSFNFIKVQDM